MFFNRLQKAINEVDVFKMPWHFYSITNTVQVSFLVEVDLTLFRMGLFGIAHGWDGQKAPSP